MQRLINDAVQLSHESSKICEVWKSKRLTSPIINQFYRSANSISANMLESTAAESIKDRKHKLSIALKESRETAGWLNTLLTIDYLTLEEYSKLTKQNKRIGAGLFFVIKSLESKI